jgi:hypothetical protein
LRWDRLHLGALGACAVVAVLVSRRLLRDDVLSADALVHQYWMWRFRDPALFTDGLTAELRESSRYPDGYEALFRLATQVVDPIAFGEWLGIGLMAVSGWLVFLIVREHTDWRPAAWIAAGLFLALVDVHRFHGGFPRAFVHPVVLLTVLLAIRRHHLAAALTAAAGALLYAPAALLACGVLVVAALRNRRRLRYAALALGLSAAAVLLLGGGAPRVLTADEARAFPEFGPDGTLRFFADSTVQYLRQNRSGFDLRASGSILALAAIALLLARPRANLRLLRTEVLALPVVALGAYVAAQLVLFRLYLPHRYTYPLLAFFAIAIGVTLRPAWLAAGTRVRAFALLAAPVVVAALAVHAFPLGPRRPVETTAVVVAIVALVAAAVAAWAVRRPATGALVTGLALLAVLVFVPDRGQRGTPCPSGRVTEYLSSLPKDAVIAGDPIDLMCLPATARRAVVISTQLAPAYEADYFLHGRERMFATLRAYYGPSEQAIADLHARYGATHLWVRREAVAKELRPQGARWRRRQQPYGRFVRGLVAGRDPAVLRLPAACRRWRNGPVEVYDIRCLA